MYTGSTDPRSSASKATPAQTFARSSCPPGGWSVAATARYLALKRDQLTFKPIIVQQRNAAAVQHGHELLIQLRLVEFTQLVRNPLRQQRLTHKFTAPSVATHLCDFTHMSCQGRLRLYEAGRIYALPSAIAHAASKRGLVAVERPPHWMPPSLFRPPETLTEAEVVEAEAELKALARHGREVIDPTGNN